MSETITFRELVRKIHPDHNPNVQDAGDKMRQATLFRNQPEELYKLAVRWGLIAGVRPEFDLRWSEPETPRPQPQAPPRPARPEPSRPVYDWRAFFNEEPVEGGHVCVTTRDRTRVQVVRVTPNRVYFYIDGKRHFAHRKNVYVVRNVRVG
jgi:hypothetical protein